MLELATRTVVPREMSYAIAGAISATANTATPSFARVQLCHLPTRRVRMQVGFQRVSPSLTHRYGADISCVTSARSVAQPSCQAGTAMTMKRGSPGSGPVEGCSVRRSGGEGVDQTTSAGETRGWISETT